MTSKRFEKITMENMFREVGAIQIDLNLKVDRDNLKACLRNADRSFMNVLVFTIDGKFKCINHRPSDAERDEYVSISSAFLPNTSYVGKNASEDNEWLDFITTSVEQCIERYSKHRFEAEEW